MARKILTKPPKEEGDDSVHKEEGAEEVAEKDIEDVEENDHEEDDAESD